MAVTLPEKVGPWTVDDLADLPEGPWRYEIVDGSLLMSPAGVTFGAPYRVPDLVVVREGIDLWDAKTISPADVELVIESVSPGSVTEDRITKPAQYAAQGIGTWVEGERVDLREPFVFSFAIDQLRK